MYHYTVTFTTVVVIFPKQYQGNEYNLMNIDIVHDHETFRRIKEKYINLLLTFS